MADTLTQSQKPVDGNSRLNPDSVKDFFEEFDWQMVEGCQAVAASHERLLSVLGRQKRDQWQPYEEQAASQHDFHEQGVPESMAESVAGNMMTTKDMIISMMNDLAFESNRRLMLEEMKAMAGSIEEFKFKDVSSAIDKLIAEGSIAPDFDAVIQIFVDKMAASERDKLLILILSQVAVTDSYSAYSGIQQLYERTHAKSKCIRYALNLVSKHYDEDSQSHLSIFVENLFDLVFAGRHVTAIDSRQLIEMIELLVKGLDVQATARQAEESLNYLNAVLGLDFEREAERMLATKQADYHRFIDWQDRKVKKPAHLLSAPVEDRGYLEDEHIDFDKKLEELRSRARALTEGLQPDEEDEETLPQKPSYNNEAERPVDRQSLNHNADAESLVRLRNNFFADAKDLIGTDDIDAVSYRHSSVRLSKHGPIVERVSAKHQTSFKQEPSPKAYEANKKEIKVQENWHFEEYSSEKVDQSQDIKLKLTKAMQENSTLQTIIDSQRQEIESLREQRSKPSEVEGLERVIMLYKSATNAPERSAAMKRMILAMFERESEPGLIANHLEQCGKNSENSFHGDLRSILQAMKSVKGLKRTMYEGILRYAIRCHAKYQGSSDNVNAIINSLVVSQTVEITIDSLIAILRDELPSIDSQYSQCSRPLI